ncbi:DUF262 domain-containing protein [Aeromonas hydrophila]|uniref:DUF262 domain-containing protein n=1 Tax=Aeromonas hydrophila TaxID=644 RepID=UPI0020B3C6D3|nr:DUF262 domain-containing protein [Aeromonas hydrophila]MCP3244118.1 DUF262 domain-containing protein [Aeromonas hydrophila]
MERRLTTQDISWFLDLHRNKQLNLNPPYQRRSVWTRKDKLFFLDTVFKGYPCPAIFLHKEIDGNTGKTTYHVVDGKQRLETIISFAENKISMPKEYTDTDLSGKKFKDISPDHKKAFWNFVIGVDQLDIIEETIVDEVFDRLNRNSRKLEKQELRHAKYDGWFINFAEQESENNDWQKLGIVTTARSKRMKDVQFISELMISTIDNKCHGFSQDFLDNVYAMYDTPEEDSPDFVIGDFINCFESTKQFIMKCEEENSCITSHARNFMHFYTLWGVAREFFKTASPVDFSKKYNEFMQSYKCLVDNGIDEAQCDSVHLATYARNAIGANTEAPQRQARHDALRDWMNENI